MNNKLAHILAQDSISAAPQLLGWFLCRQTPKGSIKLKIVEVEAYHQDDPASHSYRGETNRTAPMFKAGGHIYVYFTYGMHYCLNLVTAPAGRGEAVLIRAAEPLEGIEIMQRNRGVTDMKKIANGPGKLAQALGISSTSLSGHKLGKNTIYLKEPAQKIERKDIKVARRIGISKAVEVDARFYIKDNQFVSKL